MYDQPRVKSKHGIDLTVPQEQTNFDIENEGLDEKYGKERLR
ncbi:MAG TPA: hypothetical protein VE573_18360 [Nitrososphaeraceae archaeon]|nr:hypothetical protein [Nitrososphaeraceae archaeon]